MFVLKDAFVWCTLLRVCSKVSTFRTKYSKHVPNKTGTTYVPSFRKSTYQLFEMWYVKVPVLVFLLPQNAWQRVRYVDLVLLFWKWRYLFCLKNRTNVYVSSKGTAQCCTHFFKAVLQKTLELVKKKIHVPRTVLVFFQKIQKVSTPLALELNSKVLWTSQHFSHSHLYQPEVVVAHWQHFWRTFLEVQKRTTSGCRTTNPTP